MSAAEASVPQIPILGPGVVRTRPAVLKSTDSARVQEQLESNFRVGSDSTETAAKEPEYVRNADFRGPISDRISNMQNIKHLHRPLPSYLR
jgi:hypothetical protein